MNKNDLASMNFGAYILKISEEMAQKRKIYFIKVGLVDPILAIQGLKVGTKWGGGHPPMKQQTRQRSNGCDKQ